MRTGQRQRSTRRWHAVRRSRWILLLVCHTPFPPEHGIHIESVRLTVAAQMYEMCIRNRTLHTKRYDRMSIVFFCSYKLDSCVAWHPRRDYLTGDQESQGWKRKTKCLYELSLTSWESNIFLSRGFLHPNRLTVRLQHPQIIICAFIEWLLCCGPRVWNSSSIQRKKKKKSKNEKYEKETISEPCSRYFGSSCEWILSAGPTYITSDTYYIIICELSVRCSNKNEWAVCGIKLYKNPNAAQDE